MAMKENMYRLDVYVPASHLEILKSAVFSAGAGRLGNYDLCCWQCPGKGQFRPLSGAAPFLGRENSLEEVEEWKVEFLCPGECLKQVIAALKAAHPYETPAFQYWPVGTE